MFLFSFLFSFSPPQKTHLSTQTAIFTVCQRKFRAKLGGRTEIPPPSGYQLFAPGIDTFLKEHLFCDIFIRDNLDAQSRELATIGALGGMTGTAGQMNFHFNAAMNTGTTPEQMHDFVKVIETEVGADYAKTARNVLDRILAKRSVQAK